MFLNYDYKFKVLFVLLNKICKNSEGDKKRERGKKKGKK